MNRALWNVMAVGTTLATTLASGCPDPIVCPPGSTLTDMRCVADLPDSGVDAGEVDANGSDTGTPVDTGTPIDTGMPIDTGTPIDTGMPIDTGVPLDAFVLPDAAIDAFTPFDAWAPDACSPSTHYADTDGDGYGNAGASRSGCVMPAGYVADSTDCNDGNAAVHPGATEVCNDIDDNCAGGVDEGVLMTLYVDGDGDTYGGSSTSLACAPRAGLVANNTDCNDSNAAIHPGATETCNLIDDNCAGGIDEGVQTTFYIDGDSDTYGSSTTVLACTLPAGAATRSGDCNDSNPSVYPGRMETCNGVDDNCAGGIDDGNPGGGVVCTSASPGICAAGTTICRAAAIACDPNIAPGSRAETCNLLDDDCNGVVDNGVQTTFYRDMDADTYGSTTTILACSAPAGYATRSMDCNDSAPAVNPGATEICDGIDNDCTAGADGAAATTWCGLPTQLMALNAASAACTAGSCVQTSCAGTYRDCSAPASNCETNTATEAANCGACGIACNWNSCVLSQCDDAVQIAVGADHSCALRRSGTVVCWGLNTSGQLGNGTTTNATTPVRVTGLTSVASISAGANHTCALTTAGAVLCWGRNASRQLGDNTTTNRSTPVAVTLAGAATQVDAGGAHTCAVLSSGALYCWGSNSNGQLGNGTTVDSGTPVSVFTVGVSNVATGNAHTCAIQTPVLMSTSRAVCWGFNGSGQLGDGTTTDRSTPVVVSAYGTNPIGFALGQDHSCAITSSSTVKCVGGNTAGQLGDGTTTNRLTPVNVTGLTGVASITGGYAHNCAVDSGGVARCWGFNSTGQLGDTTTFNRLTPVIVVGGGGMAQLSAGDAHTCSLGVNASVRCWGRNNAGQLGDGTTINHATPTLITPPAP